MAVISVVKAIPSSYTASSGAYPMDISNMYADTSSTTYAYLQSSKTIDWYVMVKGFDLSGVPSDAIINSITFKIKLGCSTTYDQSVKLRSAYNGTDWSRAVEITSEDPTVYTLTPTVDYETILNMGSDGGFYITIPKSGAVSYSEAIQIYGAEINVKYTVVSDPVPNKVEYVKDGITKTLIDLTNDNTLPEDVTTGKIFHLATGEQAIGIGGGGGLEYETGTWSPSSNTTTAPTISFSNTHTDTPAFIAMWDNSSTARSTNYFLKWSLIDYDKLYPPLNQPSSGTWNGYFRVFSSTSSSTTEGAGGVGLTALPSNITSSSFVPYINGRNLRSTRVYKWIAIWGIPT